VDDPEGLFPLASDMTSMRKVHKWRRREAADTFFPDHILTQKCNQNKYNFLHDARRVVKKVDLTDVLEVELALKDVSCCIETRLLMVVMGDAKGWDVAQLLEDESMSVFKVNKDRLQAAWKQAKQVATKKMPKPTAVTLPFFWSTPRLAWGVSVPTLGAAAASHLGQAGSAASQPGGVNPTVGCFVCRGNHFTWVCPKKFASTE
jgi:hypothetical protein